MLEFNIASEIVEIVLLVVMVGSLILSLELKKLYQISLAFIVYMIAISGIYWVLGSPYLSVFQLSVYAGTTGIILFASLSVFSMNLDDEEEEEIIR